MEEGRNKQGLRYFSLKTTIHSSTIVNIYLAMKKYTTRKALRIENLGTRQR
jgi:hypothetical protein